MLSRRLILSSDNKNTLLGASLFIFFFNHCLNCQHHLQRALSSPDLIFTSQCPCFSLKALSSLKCFSNGEGFPAVLFCFGSQPFVVTVRVCVPSIRAANLFGIIRNGIGTKRFVLREEECIT